jgi:multidrug resistance protein MdtO
MAATLHCYHLAALLQPEEAPSAARRSLPPRSRRWRIIWTQHASGNPAGGQRGYGERVILQEMATTLSQLARGEPVPLPRRRGKSAPAAA